MNSPSFVLRIISGKLKELRDLFNSYGLLFLKRFTPIIVYQMGKVGSSSVRDSLKSQGVYFVFHVHRMNPDNILKAMEERKKYLNNGKKRLDEMIGESLYKNIVKRGRKIKVITLVREPIGRNISHFFQGYKMFTGINYGDASFTIKELEECFIQNFEHSLPLNWFDEEMKQILGIDVYEYSFPKDKGYLTIKKGNIELLIIKLEVDDSIKEKAIEEFSGIENFRLVKKNVAKEKNYSDTYSDFMRNVRLPESYIDLMCNSEYTKHFYSNEEIELIRSKWYTKNENELPFRVKQILLKASSKSG